VDHGEVAALVARIRELAALEPAALAALGEAGAAHVARRFSQRELCGRFCDLVEAAAER
jgi:hypothetical protein